MDIEIAEPGRMTQTGSSLLKLIQNNNMPVLDLLVREAIQNSLDARENDTDYVDVDLSIGEFDSYQFVNSLDMVSTKLKTLYPNSRYNYLAIRDSHTVGLTGNLHYDDVTDEKHYGNLLKLVYEISKAQDAEGAGGSWGLGKTVYFRIGIGMVIYYSRIHFGNGYQSRLAVSFVEDESSSNAVIPPYNGKLKRGIAWWGKSIGENKTQPVTDDGTINSILGFFNIKPYSGDETGTMVIIPYIDEGALLKNNEMDYRDVEDNIIPLYWKKSIEEYIRVAVQRWYAPRLNNPHYPYGPYLKVYINGRPLETDEMEPVFHIVQLLYNYALKKETPVESKTIEIRREDIKLHKSLKTEISGTVAFARVDRSALYMTPPNNKPSPYMYINCDIRQAEMNKSIICFTRKPGMIVSYHNVGSWADGLPESDPSHYIIALFVINSENLLQQASNISLEEYVRKSEMADHTDWNDYNIGSFNPRIISKSQRQIISKIYKEFAPQEEQHEEKANSGFGKMFGDLLLPPENYGKGASHKTPPTPPRQLTPRSSLTIIAEDTEYSNNSMIYHLVVKPKAKCTEYEIHLGIDSESGIIAVNEWEKKLGLSMPFELSGIYCSDNGKKSESHLICKANSQAASTNSKWSLLSPDSSTLFGFKKEGTQSTVDHYWVKLDIIRRDVRPAFTMLELKGSN